MIRRKLGVLKRDWLSYATTFGDCLHHFNTGQMPPPYGELRPDLSWDDVRLYLDPWYHDFAALGVPTPQAEGHFRENQAAKDAILLPLIRQHAPGKRAFEIFCADAYYGHTATAAGAKSCLSFDFNSHHLKKSRLARKLLYPGTVGGVVPIQLDVTWWRDSPYNRPGLLLNIGGLYHVERPWEILKNWKADTMILQTVVWEDTPGCFVSPAPGWSWGCRFTSGQLDRWLKEAGWEVVDWMPHDLPGNDRPEDRSSVVVVAHGH